MTANASSELAAAPAPARAAAPGLTPAEEAAAFFTRCRWVITASLITAGMMEVLATPIIDVALTQMAGNLGATQQESSCVATAYLLSNVVVLPMTAFFTER